MRKLIVLKTDEMGNVEATYEFFYDRNSQLAESLQGLQVRAHTARSDGLIVKERHQ